MSKKYLIIEIANCKQCPYCKRFELYQNDSWEDFKYHCYHPSFKPIRVHSKWLTETIEDYDHDVDFIDIPNWCPIARNETVGLSRFDQLEL